MSTREILDQEIKFFTDEQIERLVAFAKQIKQQEDRAKEVRELSGIFHDFANPDLIPLEETAWAEAAAEKHLKLMEEMRRENSL